MLDKQSIEKLQRLPLPRQAKFLDLLKEEKVAESVIAAQETFMGYTKHMWPGFIEGRHHVIMAEAFDRIISGELKRLIINMPPRFTKSMFSSFMLPSLYFGRYPDRKIIMASHTADLAVDFGRDVRNLIATDKYKKVFPGTTLVPDVKAAGRWNTTAGGKYFALGVGSAVAGKGADLFIIDDAHSEQHYIQSLAGDTTPFDKAYEWYRSGPRQRLQPDGAIVVCMTRWHLVDLTGRLVKQMASDPEADQWEIIEFPAIMPSGESLWPEYWKTEMLKATRAGTSAPMWAAQYQQNPTSSEGALVKKEWWRRWEKPEPPECEFIIQSWDTAFLKTQRSDYSACTTWGVFYLPDEDGESKANIILLDALQRRMEFPELKRVAFEMWKERQPDAFIIEGKASGMPLIFELRQMGIPVMDFTPHRGSKANPNDKVARVNGVTDLFASGMVWAPHTRWAEEVIDQFVSFPIGHDDLCFTSSTPVVLADGTEKPIMDITSDDYVLTPSGPQAVEYCRMTDPAAQAITVHFSNGREITGTGNHPVYLPELNSFVRLDELEIGDKLCQASKLYAAKELIIADTLIHRHTMRPAYVPKVVKNSRCSVLSLDRRKQTAPVYALKVKNNPVFYASGILVHNCDASTMALTRFRQGGFIPLVSDEQDEPKRYSKPYSPY